MSKSLSESAAEILNASLGAMKEPLQQMSAGVVDLGGQTPSDYPSAIGSAAAASAKEAPKPGQTGAPAEGMKTTGAKKAATVEDEQEMMSEEELEAYLDTLTEEELEELLTSLEESEDYEDGEEEDEEDDSEEAKTMKEEPELSEEEILEAMKEARKKKVDAAMGRSSCMEDVDALFNGESLSEEFRTKATTIFEAAVRSRVESVVEQIEEENNAMLAEELAAMQEQLAEQVDEYLNYVVENWLEENKLAVETGLRTEIAEDFITGLKNLFAEHYIEVPEEKADLVEEMANRVAETEELMSEMVDAVEALTEQLNEAKATEILRRTCEGLTEMQVQKIKSLAEGVEFTTEGEYSEKLAVIRESYFPTKSFKGEAPAAIVETAVEQGEVSDVMSRYVQAITKTLPK